MRDPTRWAAVSEEPGHALARLEGEALAGCDLHVLLGPRSRFGARYFAVHLRCGPAESAEPILRGRHNSGPLPSYNWIEVAETRERIAVPGGGTVELDTALLDRLFALLLAVLPPGGHIMVEYDSAQRAETAEALAHNVPPIASALGAMLFRVGFGAHFKDWQIAEGGSEGPRKLQAYKPPSPEDARRWAQRAAEQLHAFLAEPPPSSPIVRAARERAKALLPLLDSDD